MMKIFVSHALEIWWEAYGLPIRDERRMLLIDSGRLPYSIAVLGHSADHMIGPIRDREHAKVYKKRVKREQD